MKNSTRMMIEKFTQAIEDKDFDVVEDTFEDIEDIDDLDERIAALNTLLITPGHRFHQALTRAIQAEADPRSLPYIEEVLESKFVYLSNTCSESKVIAKWFSWALAAIGTDESIALIRRFSTSSDPGIAEEMMYRLRKI